MEILTEEQIKEIVAENNKLKSQAAKTEKDLKTAQEVADEQSALIESLKGSSPAYKPTIKVGKKSVRILHGVQFNGEVLSITDLEKSSAVVSKLLAAGSTAVEELIED